MKTALCISGQLRCFKQTYPSIKEHLIDPLGSDVYISTWNYLLPDERNYSDGTLNECADLYRPVASVVENFDDVLQRLYADAPARAHASDGVHVDRMLSMWECARRAFLLTMNRHYDLFIRCRFDLKFLSGIPSGEINEVRNEEKIGIPMSRDFDTMRNDQFAFGGFRAMTNYTAILSSIAPLVESGFKIHPERLLFEHLKRSGWPTVPSAIQYRVLRADGEENPCV